MVDKPAGVVVHPARGHRTGTLAQALSPIAAGGEDAARAGIVHRLDRDTSGLLVVARTEAVHRALRSALQARAITREYLALVEGRPPARSGTIDAPLGRDRRVRTRMSTDTDDPRAAVTHFEIERALPRTTLLRVRLETGRTHQIRAHLQAIGHPVVGDPEYGTPGRLGLERQFLHAARLAFAHPVTGAPVDVSSPLPRRSATRRWRWPPPSDPQLGPVRDVDRRRRRAARASPSSSPRNVGALTARAAPRRTTSMPSARRSPRGPCGARRTRSRVCTASKAG